MNEATNAALQKAYQHIKRGEKNDALALLMPIVRAEPNNADAWFLLGHALDDVEKRIYAFEQVIRLNPSNEAAQKQLAKLRPAPKPEPESFAETAPETDTVLDPAPITPEVIAKNARAANAEMKVLLRWVGAIGGVLLLCFCVVAFGIWWSLRDVVAAPATTPLSVTVPPQGAQAQSSSTPVVATRQLVLYTATPRPSVTPYPRRATATEMPATPTTISAGELVNALTNAAPTPNLTLVVMPTIDPRKVHSGDTVLKSGSLSPGQSISIPLDIDNVGVVDFILNWPAKQPIVFTLTKPDGQVIDEAYAKANPAFAVFNTTKTGFSYTVKASMVGEWKLNLAASGPGKYEVQAHFADTTLRLRIGTDKAKYRPGDLANIVVRLEDDDIGLPSIKFIAKVLVPRAGEQNVVLKEIGDGLYGLTYSIPQATGKLTFTFTASGENKGVKFTRSKTFTFEVMK